MPHDYLKTSIEKQTGRASAALVLTLMGGVLVVNSFLAQHFFARPDDEPGVLNPYLPAMLAAILHTSASAVVIFNSARLVRFGEHLLTHPHAVTPQSRRPEPARPRARLRVNAASDVAQRRQLLPQEAAR